MRCSVVLLRRALNDIEKAKEYYEIQSAGLGVKFGIELNDTIGRIALAPQAFSIRYQYLRAARLRHFPYLIYYRADPKKSSVVIFRVFNTHQKTPWN